MSRIEETQQNIIDASSFKTPEKIPVGADISGWALAYSGVNYEQVIDHPEIYAKTYLKIFDELPLDFTALNYDPIVPFTALNKVGCYDYTLSEDKTGITHRQSDSSYMGPEVYNQIIADPDKFMTDTLLKTKLPSLQGTRDEAYDAVKESAKEYAKYYRASRIMNDYFAENEIYHLVQSRYNYFSPFNLIFDRIRGIKNSLIDIRRIPEKVFAATDALWEREKISLAFDPSDGGDPLPMSVSVYHSECFLSPDLFDRLIWKYFVESIGPTMEAGKKFYLFGEGRLMHLYDKFREFPKGSTIICPDSDDPIEVYNKIGDWATIMTGVPALLLASGTKQECVDYVKRLFDTFGPNGGFIYYTNKELISSKDAKVDNLFATYQMADELSRGRG